MPVLQHKMTAAEDKEAKQQAEKARQQTAKDIDDPKSFFNQPGSPFKQKDSPFYVADWHKGQPGQTPADKQEKMSYDCAYGGYQMEHTTKAEFDAYAKQMTAFSKAHPKELPPQQTADMLQMQSQFYKK
jgi:hypothetical protein